jgi:hypothetical protein
MFGQDGDTHTEKESAWLDALRSVSLPHNDSWGALVAANFLEDKNTAPARSAVFRQAIESAERATSPDEAKRVLQNALGEVNRPGNSFDSANNDACRLASVPFGELARAVDVKNFGAYILGDTDTDWRRKEDRLQLAARVRAGTITQADLGGNVGSPYGVWATDAESVCGKGTGSQQAADLRDRLGLDDPDRFGEGEPMIVLSYHADKIPDGAAYRPTVVDAGGFAVSAAWLPSSPGGATGFTQDLRTGKPSCPEIIHKPFPARQVASLTATEGFATGPATGYRQERLKTV